MKDTVAAVITLLKADTAVKALVGTKVYRGGDIPTTPVKPFIAVDWVTRVPDSPTSSATYASDRIQVVLFEVSGAKAAILSDLVAEALRYDRIANTVVNGVEIADVDDRGAVPDNSDGPTTGTFRDNHDFKITYRLR